jgi:hypothetical protein
MRALVFAAGAYAAIAGAGGPVAASPARTAFVKSAEMGQQRNGPAWRSMGKQTPTIRTAVNDDAERLAGADKTMRGNSFHMAAANLEATFGPGASQGAGTDQPEDAADVLARMNAWMEEMNQKLEALAKSEEESEALAIGSAGKPEAGAQGEPRAPKSAEDDHDAAVMERVIAMMNSGADSSTTRSAKRSTGPPASYDPQKSPRAAEAPVSPYPTGMMKPWAPPVGYVPKKSQSSQVRQPEIEEADPSSAAAAAEESKPSAVGDVGGSKPSETDQANKNEDKKWTPPAGYTPKRSEAGKEDRTRIEERSNLQASDDERPSVQLSGTSVSDVAGKKGQPNEAMQPAQNNEDANRVLQELSKMSNDVASATLAAFQQTGADEPGGSQRTGKWQPYGGYDPKARAAEPAGSSQPVGASVWAQAWAQAEEPTRDAEGSIGIDSSKPVGDAQDEDAAVVLAASSAEAKASTKSWTPPAGYVPKNSQPAQVKQPEIEEAAPSSAGAGETTSAAESSAPAQASAPEQAEARAMSLTDTESSAAAKKWTPPTGYVPKGQGELDASQSRPWKSPTGYVPGWASQMGDNTNIAPSAWDTAGATGQDALGRAPAKRGEPNGGRREDAAKEEPMIGARSRAESSVSDSVSSEMPKAEDAVQVLARMKGLLEWGRTRMEDPSQPVDTAALDSKTSAPASKFQPYAGYDPKRRAASLEPAASEAGSSESPSAKAKPDLEQVQKPDAEQQGAEQLAEQLAAEQLAADQLKAEQLVEKLAAEQQAEKSIFNIGTSFVQQKLQEAGQMIRRVADRNAVASTDSSDETSSAAAKASARSWAPPVGYLPKRQQAAQVKQPEIEQTAPSSAGAGEGSQAEIASLQAALDKTKQAAGEYATYLEGEVESGSATAGEATQAIQAFDEDERRKEAEIASLQAALDTTKKGEDLAKTGEPTMGVGSSVTRSGDSPRIRNPVVQQKLEEAEQMRRSLAAKQEEVSIFSAGKDSDDSELRYTGLSPYRFVQQTFKKAENIIKRTADREGSKAEIASLQAALDKTKQAAGEYATYLEGEVESGSATAGEATQAIQAFDEDERRKEAEIASLQAELDTTKKGEDLAKTVFTSTDSSDEARPAVQQKLEELEEMRMRIASQKKSGIVGMASDNANLVVKQKLKELEQMRENIIARNRAAKSAGADEALRKLNTGVDTETR